jgi:transcriptional regulator with XRE-family HTH domain
VDDIRIGRLLRALRRHRGLRQVDIAASASVAQSTVSLIERGHLDRLAINTLRTVFAVVDARFDAVVAWRGGAIDRLLDERHSLVVGAVADLLRADGWLVEVEVSFAIYGERGSIDILAYHPARRTLLVVEVKTELTSIEETVRRHDAKARLGRQIAAERFGWPLGLDVAARLLVVLDSSTNRRRVARHDRTLRVAYSARGRDVRRWLHHPVGKSRGLLFLPVSNPGGTGRRRRIGRAPTRPISQSSRRVVAD